MATAMETCVLTGIPSEYRASMRCAIEREIAAIFDAEIRKAAQEFSNAGKRAKRKWSKRRL